LTCFDEHGSGGADQHGSERRVAGFARTAGQRDSLAQVAGVAVVDHR
jgi:hypothetical protein